MPSHIGLRKYILYYNISFPENDTFATQYTLMPNACGTLSLAFDGVFINAELWGATTTPILLGAEPNRYSVLLLIQLSPYGLYQITRQSQMELVNACDGILYKRMEKRVVSDALLSAATMISDCHGQVKAKEIAQQTCYIERHLNRLFLAQIGMGIKNYARLTRFNYVLKHIQKSPCFLRNCHSKRDISTRPISIKVLRLLVVLVIKYT